MNLIPWRSKRGEGVPVEESPLVALQTEMDRLFDRYLREPLAALDWPLAGSTGWQPTIDLSEDDKQIVVRAEVPGIDPKQVEVTVSGNQLTVSGEKKESSERKVESLHVSESRFGAFRRTVLLPAAVDSQKVQASAANGVLTITLPKTEAAAGRRIEVNSGGASSQ